MSLELGVRYFSFIIAMIAFSYAFYQRSSAFIIPEGIYIGAFAANSFIQIYRSFQATVWNYVTVGQTILIIPVIVGLLGFARLTKFRWVARYPVAVLSGAGVGALFGLSLRGQFLAVVGDTLTSVTSPTFDVASKAIFVVMLIPVILLFLYSRTFSDILYERKHRLNFLQRFGRIAFMILVGYQLGGYTRLAGLINLIQGVIKPVIDSIARSLGLMV